MSDKNQDCLHDQAQEESSTQLNKTVSRREFLRVAGLAGATVGLGGGLGGLLAACGGDTTTTTAATTATTATTTATSNTSTTGVETTVTTAAEAGREIKVGFVAALTGGLATFGVADQWCLNRWKKAIGDGMVLGDGKKHPITITMSDSQSDANRAAQVAGDLIQNAKVDVIMATSTPEIVNPVADQAEAMQCPCVTVDAPAEAFVFGRGGAPDKPFKWTYHLWWGFAELTTVCAEAFGQIPTNKVIGGVWPNNTDGNAFRDAFTARFTAPDSGFTIFDAGAYNEPNEDFTAIIGSLKKTGCEILTCCQIPPDFNTFWSQCKQQGLNPKIMDGSKATLFPEAVESYGELSLNLISGIWWHPTFPYKSSLSGETCQQIADGFEKETGKQWTSPLAHYIVFEAVANALQRAKDLDDKESIIQAVSTIKVDTIEGPMDFTAPVQPGTAHPFVNVVTTPLCYGQWVKGTKWPWDIVIISNANGVPDVQVQAKIQPLPV
jgi:branched-chain amino acid transport system substrate-binding protein